MKIRNPQNMTENKNLSEQPKQQPTTAASKKPNRLAKYILKHKTTFSLLFALIVVFIWAQCTIGRLSKANADLKIACEAKIDSATIEHYKVVSDVFSWSVRGDLMRKNPDQAGQHLENLLKQPFVSKAYVIDISRSIILLSTDRNESGLPVADVTLLQPVKNVVKLNDSTTRFISPITGLNTIIGISVLEADFRE